MSWPPKSINRGSPQNDLFRNFFPDVAKIPRRPESGRFWYLSLIYKAF